MTSSYHDHPATSASQLKAAMTLTARGYWARFVDPDREPFVPSDAMRQGSLVDCLITEPQCFEQRYLVATTDGRTKEGKELRARAAAEGLELISPAWLENAQRIRDILLSDPHAGPILLDALVTSQQPHVWTDEHGRQCRYLPDIETGAGGLWDLKKARSAAPRPTIAQSYQLGYDIQLAHYAAGFTDRHGAAPTAVGLITYEWEWPHDCSVMPATPELLELGRDRREQAFIRLADWRAANCWPSHGIQPLEPPAWLRRGEPEPTSDIELF